MSEAAVDPRRRSPGAPGLQVFIFALFFVFGGITSLNDIIVPKLKALFTLTHAEAMLVQSAFFAAYFVVSLPAAAIVRRLGYMRSAVIGLVTMTLGCLLFVPAAFSGQFVPFLAALFVLAAGITIVQVVANPLISMLGEPASAPSRLTFAQAFNSLGTTIFPYWGSLLILAPLAKVAAERSAETQVLAQTYVGLAVALLVVAAVVWMRRRSLNEVPQAHTPLWQAFELLRVPRFGFGTACIFLYVGAEVSIGSLLVIYLMQPSTLGLAQQDAGEHVPYYWGGAMVGRFLGASLLRLFSPGKVLACAAGAAASLLLVSATSVGLTSGWSLLAIGLFNSIMFPTIFSLACEGLGTRAAEGSGIICMAIVGGAVVPLVTGKLADLVGGPMDLKVALLVPALCYVGISAFGIYARRAAATR